MFEFRWTGALETISTSNRTTLDEDVPLLLCGRACRGLIHQLVHQLVAPGRRCHSDFGFARDSVGIRWEFNRGSIGIQSGLNRVSLRIQYGFNRAAAGILYEINENSIRFQLEFKMVSVGFFRGIGLA